MPVTCHSRQPIFQNFRDAITDKQSPQKSLSENPVLLALGLATAGIVWRAVYLFKGYGIIDGDEATVGVMAQQIRHGAFYVFYAGQFYLSALEAYLVALVSIFTLEVTPLTLKITALLIALAYSCSIYFLARELFNRERLAVLAALLSLLAPAFFTEWSMKTRGGFILACLFGNLLLLFAHRIFTAAAEQNFPAQIKLLALAAGFTWYHYPLAAPYYLTIGAMCCLQNRQGRTLFFDTLVRRRPKRLLALLDFPLFVAFCWMMTGTLSDAFFPNLFFFKTAIVAWFAVCLTILIVDLRFGRRPSGAAPLSMPAIFACFSLGVAPQFLYYLFQPIIWYPRVAGPTRDLPLKIIELFLFELPRILGAAPLNVPHIPPAQAQYLIFLIIFGLALLTLPLLFKNPPANPGSNFRQNIRLLWMHFAFCLLLYLSSGINYFEGPRHLLPIYAFFFIAIAVAIDEILRQRRIAALVVLFGLIGINSYYTFCGESKNYVLPSYRHKDMQQLRDLIYELPVRQFFTPDTFFCFRLLFALGPGYEVSTKIDVTRFHDFYQRLLVSERFGLVISRNFIEAYQNNLERQGIEFKVALNDKYAVMYHFRRDGKALTISELYPWMK